jgi:hypothetical protein
MATLQLEACCAIPAETSTGRQPLVVLTGYLVELAGSAPKLYGVTLSGGAHSGCSTRSSGDGYWAGCGTL